MTDTLVRDRCATVSGVFMRPGVSKNRRLYTKPMIIAAVAQMQRDLAEGTDINLVDRRALDMGTHHGAGTGIAFDPLRIVGKLTAATVDEATGIARFTADIPDTANGRDIAALVTPSKPYLKGVSFLGNWTGRESMVRAPDGQPADTAEGFIVKRIDYTNDPGVLGAEIDQAGLSETAGAGTVICESMEEVALMSDTIAETAEVVTETTEDVFADPGYKGAKRFKIGTPAEIRESWAVVHSDAIVETYSPKQLGRIQGKVKSAAKKAGFDIVEQTNLLGAEILEAYSSVCVDNGPADVRVSAYISDPSNLQAVTQKLATATLAALYSLDPDNDGDIDLPGDDDDPVCPACGCVVEPGSSFCPACGAAIPVAESDQSTRGTTMSEATTAAGEVTTKPIAEMNESELREWATDVQALAVAAPAAETGGEVTESAEVIAARKLVEEADAAKAAGTTTTGTGEISETAIVEAVVGKLGTVIDEAFDKKMKSYQDDFLASYGPPRFRKGHVVETSEGGEPYDPSKLTQAEFDAHRTKTYARLLRMPGRGEETGAVLTASDAQ